MDSRNGDSRNGDSHEESVAQLNILDQIRREPVSQSSVLEQIQREQEQRELELVLKLSLEETLAKNHGVCGSFGERARGPETDQVPASPTSLEDPESQLHALRLYQEEHERRVLDLALKASRDVRQEDTQELGTTALEDNQIMISPHLKSLNLLRHFVKMVNEGTIVDTKVLKPILHGTKMFSQVRRLCQLILNVSEEVTSNEKPLSASVTEVLSMKNPYSTIRSTTQVEDIITDPAWQIVLLRAHHEVVMAVVKHDGLLLRYACEYRSDRDIVIAAVSNNGSAFRFADEVLRGDLDVVMTAIKQGGGALRYASKDARANQKLVLAAVKQDGSALEFASDELKGNLCLSPIYKGEPAR